MSGHKRTGAPFVAAVAVSFLFGVLVRPGHAGSMKPQANQALLEGASLPPDIQGRVLADLLSDVFEQAAEDVSPSVVAIFSEQTVDVQSPFGSAPGAFHDFFGNDFFRRFFGEPEKQTVRGLGSGVIVSRDGYILTNNHVVEGASKLTVAIDDKTRLDAKVVGTDPQTDVAVIRVDAPDLPAARLGDSDKVRVGQWVLAVGNPFQLMRTVTSGIISAKGRSSVGLADFEDFIQTDASINPGNSGGALSDLDGQVIGINTAISTPSGGSVGIGFAIPINMARKVMDTLIAKGKVTRGYLGVVLQNVDEKLAKALGLETATGVIVADVTSGSPADKAGLRRGDVILTLDGQPVSDTVSLRNTIANTAPGTSAKLVVSRDGKRTELVATLGELPQEPGPSEGPSAPQPPGQAAHELGLTIQDLTPELAEQLGYEDQKGALVSAVEAGSVADDAGLEPGDLILSVNRTPITSARELVQNLRKFRSGDAIALLVRSQANTSYTLLTMP